MLKLNIYQRKEKAEKVRKENKIPGVIYGPNIESTPIFAERKELNKFVDEYEAGLFEINFEGKKLLGILQETQKHPITKEIIHFDIYVPSLEEEVETKVPLEFIGEAPAIKKGGVLSINLQELPISALPQNIPENIIVDLSMLTEIGQTIYVKDLKLPKSVKVLIEENTPLVTVIAEAGMEETTTETVNPLTKTE
jgi:large subunit ribosomal protein L25